MIRNSCFSRAAVVAAVAVGLAGAPALAAPVYSVVELQGLSSSDSTPSDISNTGYVSGMSRPGIGPIPNNYNAVRWFYDGSTSIVPQDLGRPGASSQQAWGWGTNDAGYVVGDSAISGGNFRFAYDGLTTPTLGASGTAWDVNNNNKVVEWVGGLQQGQVRDLDNGNNISLVTSLGINPTGLAISDSGWVAGWVDASSGKKAVLWEPVGGSAYQGIDIGGGFTSSQAKDVNEVGQAVGSFKATSGTPEHAFLYDGNIFEDLGTLAGFSFSKAEGMNNLGEIVGSSVQGGGAFYWANGQMSKLGGLLEAPYTNNLILDAAYGINDSGWVIADGPTGAYLLIPTIPEPGALTLVALGGLVAFKRRNTRRRV